MWRGGSPGGSGDGLGTCGILAFVPRTNLVRSSHKNKDVARMRHPDFAGARTEEQQIPERNDRKKNKSKNKDTSGSFAALRMTRSV